jgi:chromosomal replication initiation ATPase DnaA
MTPLEMSARDVLQRVSVRYGVSVDALRSRSRMQLIAEARKMAYTVLRAQGRSYPEIGRALGRDHTTVIAGVRRTMREAARNARVAAVFQELRLACQYPSPTHAEPVK